MIRSLERTWRWCGWLMIAAVVVFSLIPAPPTLDVQQGDKLQHVFAYFVLTGWFAQLIRQAGARLRWALGFVALGVVLEFLQGMTSWRSYDLYDMAANATGVVLGHVTAPPRGPEVYKRVERWLASRG